MAQSQPPSHTYPPHAAMPLSQVFYSLMPTTLLSLSTSKLLDNPAHVYILCLMLPMLLPFPYPYYFVYEIIHCKQSKIQWKKTTFFLRLTPKYPLLMSIVIFHLQRDKSLVII